MYDEKTNKPVLATLKADGEDPENITSLDQLPEDKVDAIVEGLLVEGEFQTEDGLYELIDGVYLNQVYAG